MRSRYVLLVAGGFFMLAVGVWACIEILRWLSEVLV